MEATVQISIKNCLESENISVPINKSYLASGKGVSGGGSSREWGVIRVPFGQGIKVVASY